MLCELQQPHSSAMHSHNKVLQKNIRLGIFLKSRHLNPLQHLKYSYRHVPRITTDISTNVETSNGQDQDEILARAERWGPRNLSSRLFRDINPGLHAHHLLVCMPAGLTCTPTPPPTHTRSRARFRAVHVRQHVARGAQQFPQSRRSGFATRSVRWIYAPGRRPSHIRIQILRGTRRGKEIRSQAKVERQGEAQGQRTTGLRLGSVIQAGKLAMLVAP